MFHCLNVENSFFSGETAPSTDENRDLHKHCSRELLILLIKNKTFKTSVLLTLKMRKHLSLRQMAHLLVHGNTPSWTESSVAKEYKICRSPTGPLQHTKIYSEQKISTRWKNCACIYTCRINDTRCARI